MAKKAESEDVGYVYRAIREYPGETLDEITQPLGYDPDIVRDAIVGLLASGVIVKDRHVDAPDCHYTAAIIRKRR